MSVTQALTTHSQPQAPSIASLPVIKIPSRLEITSADRFFQCCRAELSRERQQAFLILDFSSTHYIDSCGVGSLLALGKYATAEGIRLVAWSVHPQIAHVLAATTCDRAIAIDERTQALQADFPATTQAPLPVTHPSTNNPLKRLMDIVGAVVGLSITAIAYIPIAIAIKLDSPGPILFSQTRLGYLGQPIRIWKFRSMVSDAEARKHEVRNDVEGAFFKNRNDPRITHVGKFLRRTSLDELPQFWCVLTGSMSIVGTRPPTPDEVEQYDISQWQRLNVKAGLTGEWQVSGRSSIQSFESVVTLDLAYQQRWSLGHDLKVIWKTVTTLFDKQAGAV